jgi:hypothetical protein
MKKTYFFILFNYQLISFAQVQELYNKNDIKTTFIDSSMLKEEGFIFDKSFIGYLKTIQIIKNEKKNLALITFTNQKGETRSEFCHILCDDNESFELEIDNSEISKYLSHEYFYLNNFKIVFFKEDLSFYYFDIKDQMYKLFLKTEN